MRVMYVIPSKPEGDKFIFARRQIACMESAGITTRSFFLTSRTSIPAVIAAFCRLRREMKDFQPHIVHAQFGTMNAMACVCAGARPLVVTFRGSDLNPSCDITRFRSWGGRLLSQVAALRAESIICVTAQLKSRLWWRKSRAKVIPNGVDLSMFSPIPKADARGILGWQVAERVVLFNAGTVAETKRLDLAEAAVEKAKLQVGAIRFEVLRGKTPPERVPLYLNASDCLLITSDWEGSPNILKEALACNLPVVAVDVGDAAERLSNVISSHIVERSPEALGRCVAKVLEGNRRSNGRDKIAHLSDQAVTEKIRDIYDQVIREAQAIAAIAPPHAAGPTQNP
jgi:teichuronic acid biosynthesis glycosyltransferase TuaC